jgi:uncharacterized protein YndB with AHSA1/START domain
MQEIRWPAEYHPDAAKVFISNRIVIPATAKTVWAWLVRAEAWPGWYPNSADVKLPAGPNLARGMTFQWTTFGVSLVSVVREFEPPTRLAWSAHATGIDAYHAWLLEETAPGQTTVLTEETQNGWLARVGKVLMPNRMSKQHRIWLEGLSAKAQSGKP